TKRPVLFLPISVNPDNFPQPAANRKQNKIVFFYGGTYAPKDDFDVMLRSFINISKYCPERIGEFLLSGKCPDKKKNEILAFASENGINNVHFLRYLTDAEYYNYIANADVLI